MGAWGTGAFDNDDASDWVWELEDGADFTVVRSALDVDGSDYLEAPEGSVAIAAAEVVAALLGQPASGLPGNVQEWIAAHPGAAGPEDAQAAIAAVDRVLADESELKELWAESSDEGWGPGLADLRRRLEAAIG